MVGIIKLQLDHFLEGNSASVSGSKSFKGPCDDRPLIAGPNNMAVSVPCDECRPQIQFRTVYSGLAVPMTFHSACIKSLKRP